MKVALPVRSSRGLSVCSDIDEFRLHLKCRGPSQEVYTAEQKDCDGTHLGINMNQLTLYARQQQARLEQLSEVVRHVGRRNGCCLQMLVAGFSFRGMFWT